MSELKRCPFCGGEAVSRSIDISPTYQTSIVKCTKCGAQIAKTGLDAESCWNERAEEVE